MALISAADDPDMALYGIWISGLKPVVSPMRQNSVTKRTGVAAISDSIDVEVFVFFKKRNHFFLGYTKIATSLSGS